LSACIASVFMKLPPEVRQIAARHVGRWSQPLKSTAISFDW